MTPVVGRGLLRRRRGALRGQARARAGSERFSRQIEVMIYAGVCREMFEPATACKVAAGIGVSPDAAVH